MPKQVTRPTTDRAREALFSIIGPKVEGAKVLDLFAGSGALGLEALSRGAVSAEFVEQDRSACQVISRNLKSTDLKGGRVTQRDVFAFVKGIRSADYDLIFADPPYAKMAWDTDFASQLLESSISTAMKPDGLLIVEVSSDRVPALDWKPIDQRRYGSSTLLIFSHPDS